MSWPMTLRVSALRAEARDIIRYELRGPSGAELPPFEAGAHLEIEVPADGSATPPLIRHYSLCQLRKECDVYVIAVALDAAGRGGSRALQAQLHVGARVRVRALANHFPLAAHPGRCRFIAGGIGITPIRSMIDACEAQGRTWSLLYCARSRVRTAFLDELQAYGDRVSLHIDDEHQGQPADVARLLARHNPGEHVYCCGPSSLMRAVQVATQSWPDGSVHFEWFSAGPATGTSADDSQPFEIRLRRSGLTLVVQPGRSILETLEAHGLGVPFACREGLCRTCETPLCAGEADHRDSVLSDAERQQQTSLMVCVSRARSSLLELDL